MNDFRANDSLSEQIARHIGNLIVNGELKAGDRIQELRIASELNVSRGSVREAYLLLERRYLIEIVPRKGAVVAKLTASHVKHLFEVYFGLLGVLLRKISQQWQGEDLQPLATLAHDADAWLKNGDVARVSGAPFDFVRISSRLTDNAYLIELLHTLQPAMARACNRLSGAAPITLEPSLRLMRDVIDLLAQRNPESVHQAVQAWGQYLCAKVLDTLK